MRGFLRGVLSSCADLAVIPMADWLELGAEGRINTPGTGMGNWTWRAKEAFRAGPARPARLPPPLRPLRAAARAGAGPAGGPGAKARPKGGGTGGKDCLQDRKGINKTPFGNTGFSRGKLASPASSRGLFYGEDEETTRTTATTTIRPCSTRSCATPRWEKTTWTS